MAKAAKLDARTVQRPDGDPELSPEAGQEAALRLHEPEANAIAEAEVLKCTADADLAHHNAGVSDESMAGVKDRLREKAPWADFARVGGLAPVALALVAAQARVDRFVPKAKEVKKKLARAAHLRNLFLRTMQAAALAGAVDARRVARIEKGRGSSDMVGDLADLAALYREHAEAMRGHTFVTAALLAEAETLSQELRGLLRPKGSRAAGSPAELKAAVELRDRVWTLLVKRHTEARELAPMLFGLAQADEKVPALQSRTVARRTKKSAAGAVPSGTPAPA